MQKAFRARPRRGSSGTLPGLVCAAVLLAGTAAPAPLRAQDSQVLNELRARDSALLNKMQQLEQAVMALTDLNESIQFEQGRELREIRSLVDELRFQLANLQFAVDTALVARAPAVADGEGVAVAEAAEPSGVLGVVRTPVDSEGNPLAEGESVALVAETGDAAPENPEADAPGEAGLVEPAAAVAETEAEDDLAELLAAIQSGVVPADPGAEFQAAENNLRDGFLEQATNGFEAFLASYPEHELAGEAQFLLGEALFGQKRFDDAAAAYNQLVSEHSDHVMVPEAVLRIGMAMARAGRSDQACRVFALGQDRYPDQSARYLRRLVQEAERADCT